MNRSGSPREDRDAAGRLFFDRGGGLDGALRSQLDEAGFLLLEDVMSREWLDALRERVTELYDREADRAGVEFKQEPGCRRLANLVDKGTVFERVIAQPRILACFDVYRPLPRATVRFPAPLRALGRIPGRSLPGRRAGSARPSAPG
jgi:hypothetical protein